MILGKCPANGLLDVTLTGEKEYIISFIEPKKRFCWSLHCHGNSSYIIVNTLKI